MPVTPKPIVINQIAAFWERKPLFNCIMRAMINYPEAFNNLRAHAGYIYPELFVWLCIKDNGYAIGKFADHHIEILNALNPRKDIKEAFDNFRATLMRGDEEEINQLTKDIESA